MSSVMAPKKHYTGDFDAQERKLARVCERLGVPEEGCRYERIVERCRPSRGGRSGADHSTAPTACAHKSAH